MFQTFSRNDLPGEAPPSRGRSVFKKDFLKKKGSGGRPRGAGSFVVCKKKLRIPPGDGTRGSPARKGRRRTPRSRRRAASGPLGRGARGSRR